MPLACFSLSFSSGLQTKCSSIGRQRKVRWRVLCIFTSKCASRHSCVQFFDIATWKSSTRRYRQFFSIFTSKFAFRHSGVQFLMSPLSTYLRARRFNRPTSRLTRRTNHWKNLADFHAGASSYFRLDCLSHLLFNSPYCREVCYLNLIPSNIENFENDLYLIFRVSIHDIICYIEIVSTERSFSNSLNGHAEVGQGCSKIGPSPLHCLEEFWRLPGYPGDALRPEAGLAAKVQLRGKNRSWRCCGRLHLWNVPPFFALLGAPPMQDSASCRLAFGQQAYGSGWSGTRVCWSVNCQIWVRPVWPQREPKRTARPTLHPQKSRRCLWPQEILSLSRPKVLDPQKSRRCMRLSKILSLSRPKALLTSHLDVFLLCISASKWARSPEVVVESNFIGVVAQGCLRQHCHVISGTCRTHMWIPCEGTRTTISRTCKLRAKERSLLSSSFFPGSDLELNSNVKYLEV